ncbi:MAG: SocA family protein [Bacteroidetes bacterium]|nr:SocA family protein [Bacteroidota bacterium]
MATQGHQSDKYVALVHYICWRCQDPSKLGKTKLNKILFYSDFASYLYYRKPITDTGYIKLQFGPVPKDIDQVIIRLRHEGKVVERDAQHFGYPKKEFIALTRPDISAFTAEEISLVEMYIEDICNEHTATSISQASHTLAWELAEMGEEIPYPAVFAFQFGEISSEDLAWAQKEVERYAKA